jgi:hypothetical protein
LSWTGAGGPVTVIGEVTAAPASGLVGRPRWGRRGAAAGQPAGSSTASAIARLLRGVGFEVEDLLEPGAPADATRDWPFVTAEWARRWPSEHVWKAVKRGAGAA